MFIPGKLILALLLIISMGPVSAMEIEQNKYSYTITDCTYIPHTSNEISNESQQNNVTETNQTTKQNSEPPKKESYTGLKIIKCLTLLTCTILFK